MTGNALLLGDRLATPYAGIGRCGTIVGPVNPQSKDIRNLLESLAAKQEPTQPGLNALRRMASNAVDIGVDADEAVSAFLEATIKATKCGGSLSAEKLIALPEDEALRIVSFRVWQHGALWARKARREGRLSPWATVFDADEPCDIEADVRRHHDAPLVARDIKEALGPDLLRLLRFRLQGLGFVAIAEQENIATSSVHARVMTALGVLKAHANRTRTSEETGRLALLLIAS